MVLYYTGTGNSRYIAKRIADALGEELFDINARIKSGDTSAVETGPRAVIVTPTYAWRIPRLVREWLMQTRLAGARQVWFVMDCGSEIGNAAKYNIKLCDSLNLEYMGTVQIMMPENYIAMFDAPSYDDAREIVRKAEPLIDRAIADISASRKFAAPRNNLYDRFMSGMINPVFYSMFVNGRAFKVSDACIGCGKCEKLCPVNCIRLESGHPVWGGGCTHCMACICYCPKEAIEYGKISVGKPRYHFEAIPR